MKGAWQSGHSMFKSHLYQLRAPLSLTSTHSFAFFASQGLAWPPLQFESECPPGEVSWKEVRALRICSEGGYRDLTPSFLIPSNEANPTQYPAVIYRLSTGPKVTGPTDQGLKMPKL